MCTIFYLPIPHPDRLLLQVHFACKIQGFSVQICWCKNIFVNILRTFCLQNVPKCKQTADTDLMQRVHFANKMFSISKNLGWARVKTCKIVHNCRKLCLVNYLIVCCNLQNACFQSNFIKLNIRLCFLQNKKQNTKLFF